MSLVNSNEFFINCKSIPAWDRKKHYFEQSKDAQDFFFEEYKKITEGLTIDGVFIHPWLYFHTNFFKTPIPQPDKTEPIINPPMRDNEWYMAENYHEAQKQEKGIFLFGSRRYSKSVLESSILLWNAITRANSKSEIICGSAEDLGNIAAFLETGTVNMHPAMVPPTQKTDWSSLVQFGYKEVTTGQNLIHSSIILKNADAGKERASEKGAGGAPASVIIDECAKFNFLNIYRSLLPAISTPYGLKAVVMLSGTAGTDKLSRDAFKVLKDPEAYKILPMNWDLLENKIDPESITWKRTKFAMFTPSQMSYEDGVYKDDSTLANYLKRTDSEALSQIKIQLTNWDRSTAVFKANRERLKDKKEDLMKYIKYYPLDPEECFMSGSKNPFPVIEAVKTKNKLEESGNIGKSVDISRGQGGSLEYTLSNLERVKFPFTDGGIHNAPVVFYQDPPKAIPFRGEFVSGADLYKTIEASTDSVASFYILSRKTDIKQPIELIHASYAARPTTPNMFYRNMEMLIEAWNAECLVENVDGQGLFQYLDLKGKTHMLLADGVDWSKSVSASANPRNKIGYYPTPKNQEYLFALVLSYCWEEVSIIDENGNEKIILGVELIPDPDLLQEIIDWNEKDNFDRIIAFGAALGWSRWLDKIYGTGSSKRPDRDAKQVKKTREEARLMSRGVLRYTKLKKNN